MKNLGKNLLAVFILLGVIAFVFSLFVNVGRPAPKTIDISQLAADVNAGTVKNIAVSGDNLNVTLADGTQATSQKETGVGLTDTLKNYGATPEALAKVDISIQNQGGFDYWMGLLLPTVLPVLVMLLLFWWIFRQARNGANQAMSFGKINIRLFSANRDKVTFKDVAGLKESKEELEEVVDFLKHSKKFLDIGARIPRGVLLMGPPGTGKCVAAGTIVVTNKGLMEIQDVPRYFAVNPETSEVAGAELPTVDLETMTNAQYRASHWYDLKEQETVRVILNQGMEIEGTPEHPVVVMIPEGKLAFKPLSELRVGDLVAVKFNTQCFGALKDVGPEEAYMMGLLTGDGNLSHASRIGFTTTDQELAVAFSAYVGSRYPSVKIGLATDGITHTVTSWDMKRDLYQLGMSYLLSYDKVVPPYVLLASQEVQVAFLQGLFDTDGYFERYTAGLATVSKKLSDQVITMLLNLGVIPKRRIKTEPDSSHPRPVYEITISGTALEVFAHRVGFRLRRKQEKMEEYLATHVTGNTNVDLFWNVGHYVEKCWQTLREVHKSNEAIARIMDKVRRKGRISRRSLQVMVGAYEESGATSPAGEYLKRLLSSQLFFSPVASTSSGRARVYDFTVPEGHSFISNGFISHNTLLARAVAGESGVPFFHLSASEFVEMFVGVGASRVRDLFATAKKAAPSIIFIDEIDAVGRERGAGLGGGHDEREQTLNQILVEMDGFERDTSVIVMAATNRPDILDPALLRPGRFDRRVILDIPDIKDREEILKIHAKGKLLDKNADLRTVAVRTPGFSGADLANLINEAAISAARQNKKTVSQENLLDSIEKVMLGPARKSRVISSKEKEITAYHEAGHALVAASLKDADPIHKVSIVSRGMAGGYTLKLPLEERHLNTRAEFLADLAVSFGGYAAESLVFNDVSTGSSNDIKEATDLARQMVTRYGMSERLGTRTFGQTQEMIFLGRELTSEKDYSESVGAEIDEEINKFIKKTFDFAKKIVASHRGALDKIAKALIEKETLEKDEFYALLKGFKIKLAVIAA